MAKIIVDVQTCKGCELCVEACPKKLLEKGTNINSQGYNYIEQTDDSKCTGCKICAIVCPDAAISVYK